jgi:mono/diheme cytochrome c family protein
MSVRRGVSFVLFSALALAGEDAAAAGDTERGAGLARQWCASCHLVAQDQTSASTEAPPFASIAERSPDEISALAGFLADPHPPMPDLSLTRQEIRDLLAYIASLR